MGYVNSFNPALKFTWEIATEGNFETPVASLDINITTTFLSNTIIWQPVFITSLQIRTANYCTQSYTSSHPSHVKDSIPYSQFLRLRILCSDDSDLNSKRDEMSNFFPNVAILTASYLKHSIVSKTSIENPPWNHQPQTMKNEFLSHFNTFHPSNSALRNAWSSEIL